MQEVLPKPGLTAINTGPSGATLEHDYFHAPAQHSASGRILPCSVRLIVFNKTRLAQACY
jgi:hypothetical protein